MKSGCTEVEIVIKKGRYDLQCAGSWSSLSSGQRLTLMVLLQKGDWAGGRGGSYIWRSSRPFLGPTYCSSELRRKEPRPSPVLQSCVCHWDPLPRTGGESLPWDVVRVRDQGAPRIPNWMWRSQNATVE